MIYFKKGVINRILLCVTVLLLCQCTTGLIEAEDWSDGYIYIAHRFSAMFIGLIMCNVNA